MKILDTPLAFSFMQLFLKLPQHPPSPGRAQQTSLGASCCLAEAAFKELSSSFASGKCSTCAKQKRSQSCTLSSASVISVPFSSKAFSIFLRPERSFVFAFFPRDRHLRNPILETLYFLYFLSTSPSSYFYLFYLSSLPPLVRLRESELSVSTMSLLLSANLAASSACTFTSDM